MTLSFFGRKKRKWSSSVVLIFTMCFLLLLSLKAVPPSKGEIENGSAEAVVVRVLDGDTVLARLADGSTERVRYLLMDTPELHHPKRGVEELGPEAAIENRREVLGKHVRLEFDVEPRDRYGRLLAYVWVKDPPFGQEILVNETLVRQGLALLMIIPPDEKYVQRMHQAFLEARMKHRGLWKLAEKRLFSCDQVWEELPYLTGHFITLRIRPTHLEEGRNKVWLMEGKSRLRVVVFRDDLDRFPPLRELLGKDLRLVGKITASYNGADLVLTDSPQIVFQGP